ncbi:MAG TPA: hypothetical protein VFL88_07535 [Gemmatimonadales bacterium]|nr:hypothetical protein [Gemmatimonadales bacterium]
MNDEQLKALYGDAVREAAPASACVPPEQLLALVRKEGTEESRLATLDHVMACPRCLPEFELLRSIEQAGGGADGRAKSGRNWHWYAPVALAASILLAVAVVRRTPPPGDVARGDADSVVLHAPGVSVTSGQPLSFAWRPVPGATGYRMEVLASDGSVVASAETTDTMVTPDAARQLPAGTYNWWVRASLSGGASVRSSVRLLEIRARSQ